MQIFFGLILAHLKFKHFKQGLKFAWLNFLLMFFKIRQKCPFSNAFYLLKKYIKWYK